MSATTRLPNPGGDSGNWGTVLNDFVSQSMVASTTGSVDNGLLKTDHAAITKGGIVGIGTATPSAGFKLHVLGAAKLNEAVFSFPGSDTYIRSDLDTAKVVIQDVATAGPTIINASSGNVGIGTGAPVHKLHTVGTATFEAAEAGGDQRRSHFNINGGIGTQDTFIRSGNPTSAVVIQDVPGKVNIGPTSGPEKLNVEGNVQVMGGNSLYLGGRTDAGNDGLRLSSNAGDSSYIDCKNPNGLFFRVDQTNGGAAQMNINSTGVTFLNTTTFRSLAAGTQNSHFNFGPAEDAYIRSGQPGGTVRLQDTVGNVIIGQGNPTSKLHIIGLQVFLDNAAAIAGGLTQGAVYNHPSGELRIVV
jgi:hypothetical protein